MEKKLEELEIEGIIKTTKAPTLLKSSRKFRGVSPTDKISSGKPLDKTIVEKAH